jgi:regulator of protease activity HflC (stomatin/prohibitin superfamily)
MDFTWLSQIFDAILSLFPRRVIVRRTHGGVKWSLWRRPKALRPGVRVFWPLITDIEVIPVARQVIGLAIQNLTTSDRKPIAVGGVVVYSINDIIKAIGEKNFDVDDTVSDISRAAIVSVITAWDVESLFNDMQGIEKDLTKECRKQLRQFGVYVHRAALTDFTLSRPISLLGIPERQE